PHGPLKPSRITLRSIKAAPINPPNSRFYPSCDRIERVFAGSAQIGGRSVEEVRAEAMAAQSIKAMIDPKDIAALAVFLASDAAKSISGQVLPIDNDRQRAGW